MTCESCKNSCCKECWYAWLKIKIDNPTCQFPGCNAKILNETIKLNVHPCYRKKTGDFTLIQKEYNYGVFLHEYREFVQRNLNILTASEMIKESIAKVYTLTEINMLYKLISDVIYDNYHIYRFTKILQQFKSISKYFTYEKNTLKFNNFDEQNQIGHDLIKLANLLDIIDINIHKIRKNNLHFVKFWDCFNTKIMNSIKTNEAVQLINLENLDNILKEKNTIEPTYLSASGSIEEQNTRITMKCPMQNCNNYMQNYRCKLCKCRVCAKCNAVVEEKTEHTCKQEDIATVEFIKKSSRQCPNKNCDQTISKIDGCDVMFCTKCHTSFNYKTGKIIKDHASRHNPHYFEYLRKQGKELPRQDEINPCQQDFMENLEYDASGNSYSRNVDNNFCIYMELEHKLDHYISDKELLKRYYKDNSTKELNMSLCKTFSMKELTDIIASFITNTRSNINKLKLNMNELMITHYYNRKNDDEYLSDLKDRIDVNYNNQKNLQTFLEFFEGYGLILFSHLQYLNDVSKIKEFFSLVKDFQQKCNTYKKAMPFERSTCIKSFKWFTSYNIDSIKVMTRVDFVYTNLLNLLNLRDEEDHHIRRVKK